MGDRPGAEPTDRREERRWAWLRAYGPGAIFCVALIVVGCHIVWRVPKEAFYDQQALLDQGSSLKNYPSLELGLSSSLIIFAYRTAVSPAPEDVNPHIRCFALAFYLLCGFVLARKVLRTQLGVLLFLALLFTSRFGFIWFSSELFAGGLLCLVVWSILSGHKPLLIGVLLAMTALTKPDMPLLALVFLAGYALERRQIRPIALALAGFLVTLSCLMTPGLVQRGWAYLETSRTIVTFGQHYSSLIFPHLPGRLGHDALYPWMNFVEILNAAFPGARSFQDVVTMYPRKYLDFVALSCAQGAISLVRGVHFLLLVLAVRLMSTLVGRAEPQACGTHRRFERYGRLSLIGLLPLVVIAYLHVRYLARWFPFLALLSVAFAEQPAALRGSAKGGRLWVKAAVLAGLIAALLLQASAMIADYGNLRESMYYWIGD